MKFGNLLGQYSALNKEEVIPSQWDQFSSTLQGIKLTSVGKTTACLQENCISLQSIDSFWSFKSAGNFRLPMATILEPARVKFRRITFVTDPFLETYWLKGVHESGGKPTSSTSITTRQYLLQTLAIAYTLRNGVSFPSKQTKFLSMELGERYLTAEWRAHKRKLQTCCYKGGSQQKMRILVFLPVTTQNAMIRWSHLANSNHVQRSFVPMRLV